MKLKTLLILSLFLAFSFTIFAQAVNCGDLSIDRVYYQVEDDGPGKVRVDLTNHHPEDLWSPNLIALIDASGDTLARTFLCGCVVTLPGTTGAFVIDEVKPFTIPANFSCSVVLQAFPYTPGTGCYYTYNAKQSSIKTVNKTKLSLFPNPAKDHLFIELADANYNNRISVVNVQGQALISEVVTGKTATIPVSSLAPGIYFVRLYNDGSLTTVNKLIID